MDRQKFSRWPPAEKNVFVERFYVLFMEQSPSREVDSCSADQEILRHLRNSDSSFVFTRAMSGRYREPADSSLRHHTFIFNIRFNVILLSAPRSSKWSQQCD
jgi:hypothetical protein